MLAVNQDFRVLGLTFVHWEAAEVQHNCIQVAETEGVVAVGLQVRRVQVEVLYPAL